MLRSRSFGLTLQPLCFGVMDHIYPSMAPPPHIQICPQLCKSFSRVWVCIYTTSWYGLVCVCVSLWVGVEAKGKRMCCCTYYNVLHIYNNHSFCGYIYFVCVCVCIYTYLCALRGSCLSEKRVFIDAVCTETWVFFFKPFVDTPKRKNLISI